MSFRSRRSEAGAGAARREQAQRGGSRRSKLEAGAARWEQAHRVRSVPSEVRACAARYSQKHIRMYVCLFANCHYFTISYSSISVSVLFTTFNRCNDSKSIPSHHLSFFINRARIPSQSITFHFFQIGLLQNTNTTTV